MIYDVQLSALAIANLLTFPQSVSAEADLSAANGYLARIEERIAALADFPHRGSPRDDLIAGLRTLTFERRVLIAYTVGSAVVTVQRVISASRDSVPGLHNS